MIIPMHRRFFITATGTGTGKTALTTAICAQLRAKGQPVTALKPVISGYDAKDPASDSALILKACGVTPTPDAMATISPWRYSAPLAPYMAALAEGGEIPFDQLVTFCRDHADLASGPTLVEGVGGVMVPLDASHTTADWMEALGWPVILVAGTYLGALSHTLSAIAVLQSRNIPLHAIVLNESEDSTVPLRDTAATLELFVRGAAPVVKIQRASPPTDAQTLPWTSWPPVSWICDP